MSADGKDVECRYCFSKSRDSVCRVASAFRGKKSVLRLRLARPALRNEDAYDRFDQEFLKKQQRRNGKRRNAPLVRAVDLCVGST
jgi:hypothetical protein